MGKENGEYIPNCYKKKDVFDYFHKSSSMRICEMHTKNLALFEGIHILLNSYLEPFFYTLKGGLINIA